MSGQRVLLVGTGLIGGSIGLGLRRAWPDAHILACDAETPVAELAVERGAAHEVGELSDSATCDLVVVSVPVRALEGVLGGLGPHLGADTVVTDTGSTKSGFVEAAARVLPADQMVIGGHPMAGSEKHGIESARPDLFEGAWWILTPTDRTRPDAYQQVLRLVSALGARSIALDPGSHDRLMGTVSHLPQLLASTLMRMAAAEGQDREAILALAAGGFKDMTRIASSSPEMWADICLENGPAITDRLRAFAAELETVADSIDRGGELLSFFQQAREARDRIPLKRETTGLIEVRIDIPDRPGVLADVTTAMGRLGVNIEDLGIHHAAEGGHGILSIWLADDVDIQRCVDRLSDLQLEVSTSIHDDESPSRSPAKGT
ncbi:MAG: prephenate dehydrogenase/arogenate dehydrogenase family protein [Actinomycetota bacterium]